MRDVTVQLIAALLLVFIAIGARTADACTCGGWSKCGDLASADAVFEATIASIEETAGIVVTPNAPSATFINGGGMRAVTLKDVKSWRGETPSVVYTGLGGGDCGFNFKAGTRYLIQAGKSSDGKFTTGICSLIREIGSAAPLIEYLKALKESPAQTRVIGRVARITGWAGFDNAFTPVKSAQIVLSGPKRAAVSTDANGEFVVTDLPKGTYSVSVRVNGALLPPEPEWSEFLLGRDGMLCEELSIAVPATGSVEVIVLAEDGTPMRGAFVYLHSADLVDKDGDRPGWGLELPEGTAVVTEIPAGRYLIEINPDLGPMPGSPFLESSTPVFAVEEGKTSKAPPLRPRRASMITVSGVVRDPDGTPLADVQVDQWIQLNNGRRSTSWPHPKTDAQGRFQVNLWKDQRYVITAGPERAPWGRLEFIADGQPITITARRR